MIIILSLIIISISICILKDRRQVNIDYNKHFAKDKDNATKIYHTAKIYDNAKI